MGRAEVRRSQREARKAGKGSLPPLFPAFVDVRAIPKETVASNLGVNVRLLDEWTTQQREELYQEFCREFNDRLYEAENYISLANVLISCIAIHMTWGYTKSVSRFTKNLNAASGYVKRYGVKAVFDQVNKEYGLDLEFDSFDVIDFIEKAGKENE